MTRTRTGVWLPAAEPSSGMATIARLIRLVPRCRSRTHHTSSPAGESTRSANRSVISGPGAPVSGSGFSISPLTVVRHRYSRWSAKLAKTNPSGSGRYDFPPYSCTPGPRGLRLPAVLVHPRPGVPRRGEQVTLDPVRPLTHDGYPAALLRPRLLPPHPGGVDDRERQADLLARHVGSVDGGTPFAVDVRFCSHSHTDIMPDTGTESTGHRCPRPPLSWSCDSRRPYLPDPHLRVPDERARFRAPGRPARRGGLPARRRRRDTRRGGVQ